MEIDGSVVPDKLPLRPLDATRGVRHILLL